MLFINLSATDWYQSILIRDYMSFSSDAKQNEQLHKKIQSEIGKILIEVLKYVIESTH